MSETKKIVTAHQLLRNLMNYLTTDRYVLFSLDDAHNIDAPSWEYLLTLCQSPKVLTVLALRPFSPDNPPCDAAKQVFLMLMFLNYLTKNHFELHKKNLCIPFELLP